ncbi:alpha-galactosidase, partial [Rhodococcus sp. 06-1477-1B]
MTTMQPEAEGSVSATTLTWGNDHVSLTFSWSEDAPVSCVAIVLAGREAFPVYRLPFVEVLTADAGHRPASGRLAHTEHGTRMRYVDHSTDVVNGVRKLIIRQRSGDLEAEVVLTAQADVSGVTSFAKVTNNGTDPIVLRSLPSWVAGFSDPGYSGDSLAGWDRVTGVNDWLGEGRWTRAALRGPEFVYLAEHLTGHNPRGSLSTSSVGTWSTGHHLPTGVLSSSITGLALAWQIEHNGAWRWEIGEDTDGGYLALAGPTDSDSGWTRVLTAAESFSSVPVTVVFAPDEEAAVHSLTDHRRATRRAHPDNAAMPVVFNDYMNTLDGDPTTEKLLP